MRRPDFWDGDDLFARLAVAALTPLGSLYGATVRWKAKNAAFRAPVPVICVGNLTAGGTGKTPIAIALAEALLARGKKPFFLTRGYGGTQRGPLLVEGQSAADVGDEPLLLAAAAPAIVSRDRPAGARLAVARGADVIVMDDGHQNFSLAKDLSLVVVDGERGFGNGRVLPAGPLREPVAQGLARADAVIVMGSGDPVLAGFAGPILQARVEHRGSENWQGSRVVAFAGIGRPEKFFRTLRGLGADLVDAVPFDDHHPYTPEDLDRLKSLARREDAKLVTTEKDHVRLPSADRLEIAAIAVHAVIEPLAALDGLLDRLFGPL
jgi:tetraacyldisaccharide 4'-kinase